MTEPATPHAMTPPLPVLALVRDAYATVSAHLPRLLRLGRGPFVVAMLLGLLFTAAQPFATSPLATLPTVFAFAWFSFHVFRLVLLGPARAELPRSVGRSQGRVLIERSPLGTYMGRAVGIAALGLVGVAAVLFLVVVPLTAAPGLPGRDAAAAHHAFVGAVVLAVALAAWPVGVPLARLLPVLAATAIERETGMIAAWRLSRGHGLRLATALVLIGAPYVLGYAALDSTLAMLAAALGGGGGTGPVAHVLALALVAAMGLTMTALGTVATARAWSVMAGQAPA